MANAFKQQQEAQTAQKLQRLINECRDMIAAGKMVEAVKKYRAQTGADLHAARKALQV